MNIVDAKEEIKRTLISYLQKSDDGIYLVPKERQRPIYLLGAPGIGKTAIMKQVASEMNVGLVSYTITHHTRQSAIGLPYIVTKTYGDKEYSMTEFTLSEIIASVYDAIEVQNKKEGILFIDEINCVSETLAPAMLELLQNKKFGPHNIPEGWILVSAGNPIEYNKSAKEFDMVTLDRVRKFDVDTNYETWKKYAYSKLFSGAVIYYLQLRPQYLFYVENSVDGLCFSTPRGWEDLSVSINQYETLNYEVNFDLISQYIQVKKVALEFNKYYLLYKKYRKEIVLDDIYKGNFEKQMDKLKSAGFDERMAFIEIFINKLTDLTKKYREQKIRNAQVVKIREVIEKLDEDRIKKYCELNEKSYNRLIHGEIASTEDKQNTAYLLKINYYLSMNTKEESIKHINQVIENLKKFLKNEKETIDNAIEKIFEFLKLCFGEGQEMIAFIMGLLSSEHFIKYLSIYPSQTFLKYNELLLIDKNNKELLAEIERLRSELDL